jgi:hypothetical protein
MLIYSSRVLFNWFHGASLSSLLAGMLSCASVSAAFPLLRRRIGLFLRGLDLFVSFCVARFIVWRNTPKK